MYSYLTRVADDLSAPQVPIIVDLPEMRRDAQGVSKPALRLISWYLSSMKYGRLMLRRDYETLLQSQADADENSDHRKAPLETLLRVKNSELPLLPDLMLENPLPSNLVVPEPLILKYFQTFVGDLQLDESVDAQTSYDCAMRIAFVGMLDGALTVDHW